eukprot:TRINITY_DN7975_c0_g1_i11.p1 TRINITY_DN7975_c0_g1~~TRINITY_DN7975_c0_g1_i11.p1  ORF type:complete len:207 (-),score=58.33 TRINITY_DN7975_c0_g1_i11:34-654(-)
MEPDKELQREEMESLQCIYMDEFDLLSESPLIYELTVFASTEDSVLEEAIKARLKVEYTENYPEEAPLILVHIEHPLTRADLAQISNIVKSTCKNFAGLPIIFEVGENVKEYLQQRKAAIAKEESKAETNKKTVCVTVRLDEESMSFTLVTAETYAKWREGIDKKMVEEVKSEDRKAMNLAEEVSKRLTGRAVSYTHLTLPTNREV